MNVFIIGAGKTGIPLAEKLVTTHAVTLLDVRADRIELVRSMLPNVTAVLGDACDPEVLEQAGVATADRVVAATGDDEDNLVVAMLAKHYGSATVYARVNHPRNEWLFDEEWGVDVPVLSSEILYGLVEKDLGVGNLITLLDLDRDGITIDEITLPEGASAVGRTLADVPLPSNASVVAILSAEGRARIARGDTVLAAGDQLMLLVENGVDLNRILEALGVATTQAPGEGGPQSE